MTDPLIESGTNLLLDDLPDGAEGHYCDESLATGTAAGRAELRVTFPTDGTERVSFGDNGRQPAKRGIIVVGDGVEARRLAGEEPEFADPVAMDAVTDRSDLQSLGTTISRFAEVWANADYEITLCVDSLSDLLAANEPDAVFHFCHVLSKRLDAVGAVSHFHVDPDRHDEQLLSTLQEVFDGVVTEFEADDDAKEVRQSSRRSTDGDVARATGVVAESDEREARSRTVPSQEATDDDIADALPD